MRQKDLGEYETATDGGKVETTESTLSDPYDEHELEPSDRITFTEAGTYTVVKFVVDAHNVPEVIVAKPGLEEIHEVKRLPTGGYHFSDPEKATVATVAGKDAKGAGEIENVEKGADPETVAEYMADVTHYIDSAKELLQAWFKTPTPAEYAAELEDTDGVRRATADWGGSDVAVIFDTGEIEASELVDRWGMLNVVEDCDEAPEGYAVAEYGDVDGISDARHIQSVTKEELEE
jgi:hypothetical protein